MDHRSTLTGLHRALNGSRTAGGLDVIYTKLAVDLQNLSEDKAIDSVNACLGVLQESTGCDSVCFAVFDSDVSKIIKVHSAQADFTPCNPEQLQGELLADWPWLSTQHDHLRLIEILDTSKPASAAAIDAQRLKDLHIASALLINIVVNGKWEGFLAFLHGEPAARLKRTAVR